VFELAAEAFSISESSSSVTDAQLMAKARQCRSERLQDIPPAQRAFNELLDSMGVLYDSEAIRLNGDRFVLLDVLVASKKVAFEPDGFSIKRSAATMLAAMHGCSGFTAFAQYELRTC